MQIKLVAINGRYTHSSLALFHVRNEMEYRCKDVSTEIVQLTIRDPFYEVLLRLSKDTPDAIFFSAAVWNSDQVEGLLTDLHSLLPSCLLVVGGPQAEVVGANLGEGVCTVVRGAIEAVEEHFYTDLQSAKLQPLYGRSFFHLKEKQKKFVSPYREEDFALHLKNRNIYYESSRGCPFSCSYCLSSAENGVVHKDLLQVRRELDQIMSHDTKVLRFVDRTFNDIPDRALAIWKLVLEYDGDTLFHFEIAPDRISEEMFVFLATVPPGRFQFEIGIQSTNEETLAAINRRIDPAIAHKTVARLAALNTIHLHADLILGLPFETEESYLQSFADIFAMGPHYIQMGLLKLLPDTAISRDAEKFDYRFCKRPPYSVLANQWLDSESLQRLYWFSECVERFCNNRYFPSLWKYLRRVEGDIASFFLALLGVAETNRLFQLAATQEFLCALLVEATGGRNDWQLIHELLIYDWLCCGKRNLPGCLSGDSRNERELKDRLYQQLATDIPDLYSKKERNQFFRRTVFYQFTVECITELGRKATEPACFAFLQERESSLMKLQKVVLLPL
ncbi:MAG: DUF4080 domain-containing protein [Desulfocapsa sp.]|uniref:DUF4080 domain-containing protein n=1 Tax=Desulfotalea psychrophila TaxID=84980 RepID=A0ABS3AUP4_9BACT|nr:DUF4080 domain-containing protein [Desulfocapsa sp.]MBN4052889.1 DUF4080 domain-containing protein [bacterium AH-315-K15]MBN4068692.1 DUF4080 domain-containing protein [Desulfotalea psychrophila]